MYVKIISALYVIPVLITDRTTKGAVTFYVDSGFISHFRWSASKNIQRAIIIFWNLCGPCTNTYNSKYGISTKDTPLKYWLNKYDHNEHHKITITVILYGCVLNKTFKWAIETDHNGAIDWNLELLLEYCGDTMIGRPSTKTLLWDELLRKYVKLEKVVRKRKQKLPSVIARPLF